MTEICLNSEEMFLNVWTVIVRYKDEGGTFIVDPKTRKYQPKIEPLYQRFMINYFGMGMDAKIGTGFEKKRTSVRCCNKVVYAYEGFKRIFCCCCKPETISKQLEYLKTKKDEHSSEL